LTTSTSLHKNLSSQITEGMAMKRRVTLYTCIYYKNQPDEFKVHFDITYIKWNCRITRKL